MKIKTVMLILSLFISSWSFAQSCASDSIKVLPTRAVIMLKSTVTRCYFGFPTQHSNHTLAPDGSRVRGREYERLVQMEQNEIRTGLRGQYSHYYINGIRVRHDFMPGEIIEDIRIIAGGTPAFDEGEPILDFILK